MSVVGVATDSIAWGFHSSTSLSGTPVWAGRGLGMTHAAYLPALHS